jgi:DNA polymerase-3 subunit alpha
MAMPEIEPPKLSICEPWPLITQLDFEKEVTGMYISGHPLDNYKFEMKHYNINPLAEYNEFKNSIANNPNPGRSFRLAGLVTDGQHRLTKTGKNFGIITIEDFTGKSDFFLWGEDYVRYNNYLEKGTIILVEGGFKTRYNSDQYEFRLTKIHLLDTVKTTMTKQVIIDIQPQFINANFVNFIEGNIKTNPGATAIKFNIVDTRNNYKVGMYTLGKGFTMNDEMAVFLNNNVDVEVSVVTG